MNRSTKAVLLSALVFPGAGHLLLKKFILGFVLAGAAFVGLYFLIAGALANAWQIAEKIQSGEVPPDVGIIMELASQQATGAAAQPLNIALAVLCVSWLIGIADSYRVGRAQDQHFSVTD